MSNTLKPVHNAFKRLNQKINHHLHYTCDVILFHLIHLWMTKIREGLQRGSMKFQWERFEGCNKRMWPTRPAKISVNKQLNKLRKHISSFILNISLRMVRFADLRWFYFSTIFNFNLIILYKKAIIAYLLIDFMEKMLLSLTIYIKYCVKYCS